MLRIAHRAVRRIATCSLSSMDATSDSIAIGPDSGRWLHPGHHGFHGHRNHGLLASPHRRAHDEVHVVQVTDSRQSRIVNNALRREIDRLARGIDDTDSARRYDDYTFAREDDDRPPNELASPPVRATRAASCDTTVHEVTPPPPPERPDVVIAPLLMNNMGSLLDLLA